jgi:chemotaxis methyl-accepting protein methylase
VAEVLGALRAHTAVDFSRYRPTTVHRRLANRMRALGVETLDRYLDILTGDPSEPQRLLERLTLKVSRFYRNAWVFDHLRFSVIPQLVARRRAVTAWSAGCARGEEAYTLAMLIDEAGGCPHVVATDLDPAALTAARGNAFQPAAVEELPADLRERYLMPAADGSGSLSVRASLARAVRFEHHDLTSGAGLAHEHWFALITCRNVLIYLQPEAQRDALRSLCGHLAPGGFLCLGEAEWPLGEFDASLEVFDRQARIFRISRTDRQ